MCLYSAHHSPFLSLCSKQLCRDNSYYCLLSFMIGFHIQYDLLITVPRTSKGDLPHPINITVNEHQSEQGKTREKRKKKHVPVLHRWLEVSHILRQTCLSDDKELHKLTTTIK